MIANDPVIDKFIHDYATSTISTTCDEWAEKYGVDRRTITNWIKDFNEDIERINSEETKIFSQNFHKLEGKVYKVINASLDEGDKQTAIACLPFFKPKKEHIEVDGAVEVNQPISIAIAKMRQDSTNVTGES